MTQGSHQPRTGDAHAPGKTSGDGGRISVLAVPPAVWAVHFTLIYALAALDCVARPDGLDIDLHFLTILFSALALLVLTLTTILAWRNRPPAGSEVVAQVVQNRFLSRMTLALSLLAAVAIIVQASPVWLTASCF